jgi:hypothetical protein
MMSNKNDGGPAFPNNDHTLDIEKGMTVRDYFAAKAMQAMIANNWLMNSASALDKLSVAAYEMADAMLMERAK